MLQLCLVGSGGIAAEHMKAFNGIGSVYPRWVISRLEQEALEFAREWRFDRSGVDLAEALSDPQVDLVVIASPSAFHAAQTLQSLRAGKNVIVEIPVALNLGDAEQVARCAEDTGRRVLVCHTMRSFPAIREIRRKVESGELHVTQVAGFFAIPRRRNQSWAGQRQWIDNLLWHHACHQVDAALWALGVQQVHHVSAMLGRSHPDFGMAMDASLHFHTASSQLVTQSLTYNAEQLCWELRFIGDEDVLTFRNGQFFNDENETLLPESPYFAPYPIFIDHGQGHYLFDVDGNQYLDFMINATSLIMGHAHPLVVQAIQEQAARGTSFSGPAEAQIGLAKTLCDRIPSVDKIRFTSSGTEGTLNAIRVARAFTGKHKIAKFEGIFHGSHEHVLVSVNPSQDRLGPVEPTAIPEFPGQPLGVLADVVVLPYNDLEASERLIRKHKDELACVIMEAIASNLRYVPAKADFLMGIRELTTKLGILLIFDEVQSFRVAPGGAQELFGVIPEITTLGKLIGGGMPVGAFGGREDIMALYDPSKGARPVVGHVGTFNANPMTMVGGETTMKQLTTEVYQRLNRLGNLLRQKLRTLFEELEVPAQITGVASLFGIHFTAQEVTDYRSALRGDSEMKSNLFMGLLNEGVLLQTNCAGALNALTRESEVDALVEAIRRVVQRIRR